MIQSMSQFCWSVRIDNWWISTYNPLPNFKILNLQIQIRPIAIMRIRTVVYRLGTTGSWLWLRRHHRLFHWCSAVACAMKNSNSSVNRWAWSSKVASVFSAVTTAYLWAASTVPTDSSLIVISHTVKEPHAAMVKKIQRIFSQFHVTHFHLWCAVRVECTKSEMLVTLAFGFPFNGRVHATGNYRVNLVIHLVINELMKSDLVWWKIIQGKFLTKRIEFRYVLKWATVKIS